MGWLNNLFKKEPEETKYAQMLSGYTPAFTQFGQNIYASDVVQQALNCIIREMKKVNPRHIREMNGDRVIQKGNIQAILEFPNEIMPWTDFIEKFMWSLLLNHNAFALPTYITYKDSEGKEQRVLNSIIPIQPTQVDFIEDQVGTLFIKFTFANGYKTTIEYKDVIHVKSNYSVNDYMGGDSAGQPNNEALLKTLELNNVLLQGIAKAMKASFSINGIVKSNTLMDKGKTELALKEFEEKLEKSGNGFASIDLKAEYTPIKRDIQMVDEATLKFIDEKILRTWGTSIPILTGDYTKAQYEAFYQKTLEPFIISISAGLTKALFTPRERAFGNKIELAPPLLIFLSVEQTIEVVRLLGDSGTMLENEKRESFGLAPLPELVGKRMQSLNYANVDTARVIQEKGGAKNEQK